MTDKARISTFLSEEEELALRILSAKHRMSMSAYLATLVRQAIDEDKKMTDKVGQANKEN